uniref:Uncharacterized protein n=1 Tax=Peronospora matthiolae TaxID=2874970 RepID=A0AAV1VNI2_9STRA
MSRAALLSIFTDTRYAVYILNVMKGSELLIICTNETNDPMDPSTEILKHRYIIECDDVSTVPCDYDKRIGQTDRMLQ